MPSRERVQKSIFTQKSEADVFSKLVTFVQSVWLMWLKTVLQTYSHKLIFSVHLCYLFFMQGVILHKNFFPWTFQELFSMIFFHVPLSLLYCTCEVELINTKMVFSIVLSINKLKIGKLGSDFQSFTQCWLLSHVVPNCLLDDHGLPVCCQWSSHRSLQGMVFQGKESKMNWYKGLEHRYEGLKRWLSS